MNRDQYIEMMDRAYLSDERLMTDLELHNVSVKMDRALELFDSGFTPKEIKEKLKESKGVQMQPFERARDQIQRELIDAGFKKGSKEYLERENKMLLQWASSR